MEAWKEIILEVLEENQCYCTDSEEDRKNLAVELAHAVYTELYNRAEAHAERKAESRFFDLDF